MRFKYLLLWIAAILTVISIVFFAGFDEIKAAISSIDPFVIIFLCILQVLTLLLGAYKWRYLLVKVGKELSLPRVFSINMAGNFIESITPSVKLGGEAAKVYLFRRYTSLTYPELAGVLLTLKYISLLPFVILCGGFIVTAAFLYELPPVVFLAFLFLGVFFAVVTILFKGKRKENESNAVRYQGNFGQKNGGRLLNIKSLIGENNFRKAKEILVFVNESISHSKKLTSFKERRSLLCISLLVWLLYPCKVYIVAQVLGYEIDLITAAVVTFTAYLISMLPLFPGGLGTFEGSMAFMFTLADLLPAEGLAVAVVSRLITYWFPLLLSSGSSLYLTLETTSFSFNWRSCKPGSLRGR